MSEDGEDGYGLVVSFGGLDFGATVEQAFVHGAEFGQIWQRMQSGAEAEIETTIHTINATVISRAATADGWDCLITPSEVDGWSSCLLVKRRVATANPHGLRIVGKD